jgi:hypothetical protein
LLSADEFNFSATYYSALPKTMQNVYTWQDYPFDSTETPHDYARIYQQVNYTNVVLEGVSKLIEKTGRDKGLDRIKGDALFKRALAFYHCLQIFAPAYDNQTATTDLGIPLILKSAEDRTITRPSVQECYDQILSDLKEAGDLLQLLPDQAHRNRASRMAALALLARVYLGMDNWQQSATMAAAALQGYDSLVNFNSVNGSLEIPFPEYNKEVIYPLKAPDSNDENALVAALAFGGANVDSNLIRSYEPGDLRLNLFFYQRGRNWGLRPTFTGLRLPFEGLSVSEIYLTLAESNARLNKPDAALYYLDTLLRARYKTGTNPVLPTTSQPDLLLDRILNERKKELAFRGERWADIKRLNKLNHNIIQQRIVDKKSITIAANDMRYALPLPEPTVRKYYLTQNPR